MVRTLDAALPQPPSLLAQVRGLFNRFGFPDVFSGIPPLPAEPVDPPTQAEAAAAAAAAASSTVQVIGPACDVIQEGSGFVAAEGYVVTNAHVVAGMDDPEVRSAAGASSEPRRCCSTRTSISPSSRSPTRREPRSRSRPSRSSAARPGPCSGTRMVGRSTPAAPPSCGRSHRVGPDIYGRTEVDRLVVELQTVVRPGNSGGPFVLSDGRVGGVVFAASSADEDIGYAIAADEVDDLLQSAIGRTSEVDTGPCIG